MREPTALYGQPDPLERKTLIDPLAQKTLFYGFLETTATSLADEAPSGAVFDLKTMPANLTFSPEIRAGVCDVTDPTARILHLHGTDATILPPAGSPNFCTAFVNTSEARKASICSRVSQTYRPP